MKIYESAVRKPVSTVLMFVGVMVFGLFSLMNLAVDQYPEIEIPQISVITFYPGANAADIETNITRILEDNLNTVSNLKKLTSKSQDNVSMIIVEFEYGSDLTECKVTKKFSAIKVFGNDFLGKSSLSCRKSSFSCRKSFCSFPLSRTLLYVYSAALKRCWRAPLLR